MLSCRCWCWAGGQVWISQGSCRPWVPTFTNGSISVWGGGGIKLFDGNTCNYFTHTLIINKTAILNFSWKWRWSRFVCKNLLDFLLFIFMSALLQHFCIYDFLFLAFCAYLAVCVSILCIFNLHPRVCAHRGLTTVCRSFQTHSWAATSLQCRHPQPASANVQLALFTKLLVGSDINRPTSSKTLMIFSRAIRLTS